MTDIRKLLRPNIASLNPYSSARHEFDGHAQVYLDANENPFESALNRYPDPLQSTLKGKVGALYDLRESQIFLGNGSDEAIDLLIRSFCRPAVDRIIIMPPTYGMYKVSADINDVGTTEVPLTDTFSLDRNSIKESLESHKVKLIFACSPNNPTGSQLDEKDIEWLLDCKDQIIILDEAYADFALRTVPPSQRLDQYKNLVILRTFSKAWGMAGARLGLALASEQIIEILNSVKPPYNINSLTQSVAGKAIDDRKIIREHIEHIIAERTRCGALLEGLNIVDKVYPSEANFLLVKFQNANAVFRQLLNAGIVVRDRQKDVPGCLRITIGTREENDLLLRTLNTLS